MLFLGIDVSKDKLDGAAVSEGTGAVLGRRSVPNTPDGVARLRRWAETIAGPSESAGIHAVIEATAAYHEPAAYSLAAAGVSVSIVNPAQVRSFARGVAVLGKTDRLDAVVLARFGRLTQPKAWRPSAPAVRDLQALLARLDEVEADLRREANRLEQARVRGCPEAVLRSFADTMAALKASRSELRRAIDSHVAAHPELQAGLDRLLTIPAVGPKTGLRMLGLLRSRGFESAREVAAFLGLVPVEHRSGTSVRGRPKLSKAGNPRLRAALYMVAVVATRLNPDVRAQYQRLLARGKSKMAALGAAMRKLVHLCFGVLKSGGDYRPAANRA
jgi:transposase